MSAILRAYSTALRRFPTTVQSLQAGGLMAVGDVVSQFSIEGRTLKQYEWRRSARFFAIGTFLVGPTLRLWYSVLDKQFGALGKAGALRKVFVDQAFFAPCFLLVFLTTNGLLQGSRPTEVKELIVRDYKDIVLAGWMVWPAVQVVNFMWVPLRHQVLLAQSFALFWNTYLAWKTNRVDDNPATLQDDKDPILDDQDLLLHAQDPLQHGQALLLLEQDPLQHTQVPLLHEQVLQHDQVPLLHDQVPLLHDQVPLQHEQDPLQHEQDPLQHEQDPLQHDQDPLLPAEDTAPLLPQQR